jgi:glutamate-ammonia-ligase adenylyltransferase
MNISTSSLAQLEQSHFYQMMNQRQLPWESLWGGNFKTGQMIPKEKLAQWLEEQKIVDEISLKQSLRQLRYMVMMGLIQLDFLGKVSLEDVCSLLSDLADLSIQTSISFLSDELEKKYGKPFSSHPDFEGLWVVAMGKLGGRELNVSSDIDLIYLYETDGETSGPRVISNEEFYTHLARRLGACLSENNADGFVFRVDIRLRPNGDSGPLVCSLSMLESYFLLQGRTWERMAWCKARLINTNKRKEELFHSIVHPFVFRKYMDAEAVLSIADLSRQIQQEQTRRQTKLKDIQSNQSSWIDVKLSRGGIREIEFIAHWFQLTWGGRFPLLQQRPTLIVLAEAEKLGYLKQGDHQILSQAYRFFRRVEHVLQYQNDEQTHRLWLDKIDFLETLAAWMKPMVGKGLSINELLSEIERQRNHVMSLFDRHILQKQSLLTDDLGRQVFGDNGESLPDIWRHFLDDQKIQVLPVSTQGYLKKIARNVENRLADKQEGQYQSDAMVGRLISFLESIKGRKTYLSLLAQYPEALKRLVMLLDASPWVSRFLTSYPMLLDDLLQPLSLDLSLDVDHFTDQLLARLSHTGDQEQQMEWMREEQKSRMLNILVHDIAGSLTVERVADALSMVADVCLKVALQLCWGQVKKRHRSVPKVAILGFGKLGGKELGYGSDLDLVFVYEKDELDEDVDFLPMVYGQLVQRMMTWMTAPMRSGSLYEVDLRLRPDGGAGLLISEWESFCVYQRKKAWDWEHQALSRARFVAGDIGIGTKFELFRNEILSQHRDLLLLKKEIHQMRQKMREHHKPQAGLFDLKHGDGGLIDFEFCVQFWVLAYSGRYPALLDNLGNIALANQMAHLNVPEQPKPAIIMAASEAYRQLRAKQHALRLAERGADMVSISDLLREREAIHLLYEQLFSEGLRG